MHVSAPSKMGDGILLVMSMAPNLASPRRSYSSPQFSPLLSSSSTALPVVVRINPSCSLRKGSHFPSRKIHKSSIATATSIGAENTSVAEPIEKWDLLPPLEVGEINANCKTWVWKGYTINYLVYPQDQDSTATAAMDPPLLLVHGFGASIAHWRRNIPTLAQSRTVYAIDLLGFGASDKPAGFQYSMEIWAQLILDFTDEIIQKPTVLVGNSVGSLACVIAAAESTRPLVQGLVLLNCAGGMNNKAVVDDWRIKLLLPLLWLFDFLLKQKVIASYLFDRVRQSDNLRNVLLSVYGNKESVDDALVEIIRRPALDEGALDAFVSIVTGPPGPNPVQLMQKISSPVLVLWGDEDPFTPIDGPVGKYFTSLPAQLPNIKLFLLEGVGHCPHDDMPHLVHEKLLPWLASQSSVPAPYAKFQDKLHYMNTLGDEKKRMNLARIILMLERNTRELDFSLGGVSSFLIVSDLSECAKTWFPSTFLHGTRDMALHSLTHPFANDRVRNDYVLAKPSEAVDAHFKYVSPETCQSNTVALTPHIPTLQAEDLNRGMWPERPKKSLGPWDHANSGIWSAYSLH